MVIDLLNTYVLFVAARQLSFFMYISRKCTCRESDSIAWREFRMISNLQVVCEVYANLRAK